MKKSVVNSQQAYDFSIINGKKIFNFIVLFLVLVLSTPLFSQVIYTDIIPDQKFISNDSIYIDVNNDGHNDCALSYFFCDDGFSWSHKFKIKTYDGCQIAIKNDNATAILQGETIDANLNWSDTNNIYIQYIRESVNYTFSGNWQEVREGFIALKLNVDNETHYAWIRIHFNNVELYYKMWAADYAYNESPDSGIIAGQSIPLAATSVFIEDKNDSFDGSDIEFSFTKAIDESIFSEYRLILAKAGDETAMDVNVMSQVSSDRYFSLDINPNDSSFTVTDSLIEESIDKDGDPIEKFTDYQAFVLNLGNIAALNMLSAPSNTLSLQSYINAVDAPWAKDEGNTNTSSDIKVSFISDISTAYISEFRAFIIPFSDTISMDAQSAWELSEEYYTSIPIQEENDFELYLKPDQLDILGHPIEAQKDYQIQILSVPDSTNCRTAAFSEASRRFYLDTYSSFYAGQKEGEGVQWFECDSLFAPFPYINGNNPNRDWQEYEIDLNRDGINDIFVKGSQYSSSGGAFGQTYWFSGLNENKVLVSDAVGHENWVEIINEGDPINTDYSWFANTSTLKSKYSNICGTVYDSGFYNFSYNTDIEYFIAFLLKKDNNTQYAWLKLIGPTYLEYGFTDNTTGQTELMNQNTFQIFPNPAKNKLHIYTPTSSEKMDKLSVLVINSMGVQMETFQLSQMRYEKDISTYSSGMYFFVIKQDGVVLETQKIMIE
jgi:hypothetical protein